MTTATTLLALPGGVIRPQEPIPPYRKCTLIDLKIANSSFY